MADVAKLADVSHQTVSRVINGSTQVRPETRERVLAAMRKLEYRPNTMARALATGRSRTLGVVGFDTTLYGPATALFGINHAAHEEGYFISTVSMRTLDRASILEAVERLRVQGVEGILVIAPQTDAAHAVLQLPDRPAGRRRPGGPGRRNSACFRAIPRPARSRRPSICSELGHGTVLAHRRPRELVRGASARRRLADEPCVRRGSSRRRRSTATGARSRATSSAGELAADRRRHRRLRRERPHGARPAPRADEAGRSVPDDVCVVGFDDVPEAAFFTPPLTTMRQDFAELGRQSFHLLLDEIARGDADIDEAHRRARADRPREHRSAVTM